MKKGILFDLDGTLWDSTQTVLPVWNAAFLRGGAHTVTHTQLCSYMGKTMEQIGALVMPELMPERRLEIMRDCFRMEQPVLRAQGAYLYPGVEEILAAFAQEYTLAVVSNCQDGYIEAFLDHYGFWKYFSDHECAKTGLNKGGNIALVCRRNALTCAVYVGDTQADADAAAQAGLPFVWASYGFGTVMNAVASVSSLTQLPDAVRPFLI